MKTRICLCFVTLLILAPLDGVCIASDEEDFQYWNLLNVNLEIDKNWAFSIEERLSFGNDAKELSYHSSDFGFIYKGLSDSVDLGINFRKVYLRDRRREWKQEDRPHLNLRLKTKLFGFDVSDRSRLEFRAIEGREDIWRYRNMLMVMVPVEFAGHKISPFLAEEVFISLNGEEFNKNRLYSGLSFKLSKNMVFETFYLWQASKYGGRWEDTNIIGTGLRFFF